MAPSDLHTHFWHTQSSDYCIIMHPKTIDFWLGFEQFFLLSQHSNTLSKMKKSFTTVRSFAQWHSKRFVFDNNRAVGQRVSHNMKLLSLTQPLLTPTSWDQLMASLVFFSQYRIYPCIMRTFFALKKVRKLQSIKEA